ncbi:SHOCT domain-containing protein, partial [Burkholderia stagnalis]
GVGAGLAAGAAIGQAMAGQLAGSAQPAAAQPTAAAAQPTPPAAAPDYVQRLEQLKALHDKGLVTDDEYARAKAEILAKLTQ